MGEKRDALELSAIISLSAEVSDGSRWAFRENPLFAGEIDQAVRRNGKRACT